MREFILMMAALTALVALSIDAMLPALGVMAADLGVTRANDIQLVIGFIFIGLTIGQLFYGPLSDAIGRKRALFSGLVLFVLGSLLCWSATSLPVLLLGRLIQGIGVAAPRIVTTAIVRDRHHGRDMAYIMSMVMGVFILVPAIAPSIGQYIIHVADWRAIFLFYIVAAFGGALWAATRLEESLPIPMRRPFHLGTILRGMGEAARTRVTFGYTICSGLAFGALLGYLNSSQQIFQDMFHAGERFAIYFGLLALAIGCAFFSNSALVRRLGMRRITRTALCALVAIACVYLLHLLAFGPHLLSFMLFAAASFFCLGLSFGNMNAMGLEPMGHMAGLASAFMGAFSSALSLALGTFIGQLYNGTLLPLALGFLLLSTSALLAMQWTERRFPFTPSP